MRMLVLSAPNGGYARWRAHGIGALRAEVVDHDVSIKSADKRRFTKSVGVKVGTRTPPSEFLTGSDILVGGAVAAQCREASAV